MVRTRPTPDIRELNVPAGKLTVCDDESHGFDCPSPRNGAVDVTWLMERPCAWDELRVALPALEQGLQEAVRAVWQSTSENTGSLMKSFLTRRVYKI